MNKISIFVGPRKTGTSWLYHVVFSDTQYKEIRYPSRIGRNYVYNKYVKGKSLLVWPYLLHDRNSLDALLSDMESHGQQFELYVSMRDSKAWQISLTKFIGKYRGNEIEKNNEIATQVKMVSENLEYLESKYSVVKLKIIHPDEDDIKVMSEATGVDRARLIAELDTRIYESVESSRIKSSTIVELFFKIKPFLPKSLQTITRKNFLRNIFFERRK